LIKSGAIKWKIIPDKWKDDVEIVCSAFNLHKIPVRLCVVSVAKLNEKVIRRALQAHRGPEWEEIHLQQRSNPTLLSVALRRQKISSEDIPKHLQKNDQEIAFYGLQYGHLVAEECSGLTREFLKEKLEAGALDWVQLPPTLRDNIQFARSVLPSSDSDTVTQILVHFGDIRFDQVCWRELLKSNIDQHTKRNIIMDLLPPQLFAPWSSSTTFF
jgi:hypothetical protein